MVNLRNVYAFFLYDLKDWSSYRFEVFFWLLNIVIGAFTYAYLGVNMTVTTREAIAVYGGSYLAYLLVGMAFNDFINASLYGPREIVNPWNLEWRLMIPASLFEAVLGSVWFRYSVSGFHALVYFVFAIMMGAQFNPNILSVLAVLLLGMAAMLGFGMISAGVQIITKRWDPVLWLFSTLGWLLSGVWFPVDLLPRFLRPLSWVMPQTYILEMLRLSIIRGAGLLEMTGSVLSLLTVAFTVDILGILVLNWSIKIAKKQGTVGYY